MLASVVGPVLAAPLQLTREQASELARRELADPAYHSSGESLLVRALRWLLERVLTVLDQVGSSTPGGWTGLLALAVLLVALVTVVRWRLGPMTREAGPGSLFDLDDTRVSAAEHRRRAQHAAAAGQHAEAVRERLRAVVRDLEERGILDPRPGRTADEAALDAGRALGPVAGVLRDGARVFDEIWYGARPADAASYAQLVALDDAVAAARPGHPQAAPAPGFSALPR